MLNKLKDEGEAAKEGIKIGERVQILLGDPGLSSGPSEWLTNC